MMKLLKEKVSTNDFNDTYKAINAEIDIYLKHYCFGQFSGQPVGNIWCELCLELENLRGLQASEHVN